MKIVIRNKSHLDKWWKSYEMPIFLWRSNETRVNHHTLWIPGLQVKPPCKPPGRSNFNFLTWARMFLTLNMAVWILVSELKRIRSASRRQSSAADPDPDPYVFAPLGSGSGSITTRYGSGSFYNQTKIVRKPKFLLFCDFFIFLSMKNHVNVSLKSRFLVVILKGYWRKYQDPDPESHPNPDPVVRGTMDTRIRIHNQMSRVRDTATKCG